MCRSEDPPGNRDHGTTAKKEAGEKEKKQPPESQKWNRYCPREGPCDCERGLRVGSDTYAALGRPRLLLWGPPLKHKFSSSRSQLNNMGFLATRVNVIWRSNGRSAY